MAYICRNIVKKRSAKILASLMLLMTFVIGQVIVYGHNHKAEQSISGYAKKGSKTTENKCPVCVQHGHVQLFLQTHHFFFFKEAGSYHEVTYVATYQSIKLLLSGNRGPPAC
jgi:hypothetical protein